MAVALLGEGDSGDLGQRPGQASPGEQEAWRETQTPPAAATHTSGHAPGPRYPQVTASELCTSSVPGPRHSPPHRDPSSDVSHLQGHLGGTGQLLLLPAPPQGCSESPPCPGCPAGSGCREESPAPGRKRSLDLTASLGLNQARPQLRAGPRLLKPAGASSGLSTPAQDSLPRRVGSQGQGPFPPSPCRSTVSQGPCPFPRSWWAEPRLATHQQQSGREDPSKAPAGTTPGDTPVWLPDLPPPHAATPVPGPSCLGPASR